MLFNKEKKLCTCTIFDKFLIYSNSYVQYILNAQLIIRHYGLETRLFRGRIYNL